jgi:heptosyltransferase-2
MRTLILAPHSLRDAVLSQPFVATLSRLRLQDRIDVVASAAVAPVFECMAGIERVWSTDCLEGHRNTLGLLALARQLRRIRYQRAYVLGDGFRPAWLAWLTGAPVRIGFSQPARWGLITEKREPTAHAAHAADRARIEHFTRLAFNGPAPMHGSVQTPVLQRSSERETHARQRTRLPANDFSLVVLCFDDQGHASRRWPVRHWAALISQVRSHWPEAIVAAVGDASVRTTATEAFALSGVSGRNWCGQLSQADLIATVAQAQAILGLDNDLMLVAGAFGRPLVSLFGPRDPRRHAPLGAQVHAQSLGLACSPCNDPVCRHGHGQCMTGLTPNAAAEALRVALRRTSRNIR